MRSTAWFVYILRCADGSLYTGITTDLDRRLEEHNSGRGAKYTRSRRPVELCYREPWADRAEASRREVLIKGLPRARKLELVAGNLELGRDPAGE